MNITLGEAIILNYEKFAGIKPSFSGQIWDRLCSL
jgi:hypothetical protein